MHREAVSGRAPQNANHGTVNSAIRRATLLPADMRILGCLGPVCTPEVPALCRDQTPWKARNDKRISVSEQVSVDGIEPSTNGLKGRCSTSELHAHTGDIALQSCRCIFRERGYLMRYNEAHAVFGPRRCTCARAKTRPPRHAIRACARRFTCEPAASPGRTAPRSWRWHTFRGWLQHRHSP